MTAGTDRKVFVWDIHHWRKKSTDKPKAKELELAFADSVSCLDWSDGGVFFAIGKKITRILSMVFSKKYFKELNMAMFPYGVRRVRN